MKVTLAYPAKMVMKLVQGDTKKRSSPKME